MLADINAKREKLSIYLAKDNSAPDDKLIDTKKTKNPVQLEALNCKIVLYPKKAAPLNYPKWAGFLTTTNLHSLDGILDKSTSTGAILIVRAHKKTFLITFGSSFHIINSEAIERDFGLRVTLNTVDANKLRSLDKSSYNHNPLNSRNQSTMDVDIFDLSIDAETDLVYALTGASSIELFGSHVTGRDALVISPYVTLNTLHQILATALEQYQKPLPAEFSWIDNINKVKDAAELEMLDKELDKHLGKSGGNAIIWLGEPEVINWEDQIGYSFDLRPKTERHVVLKLKDLQNYFQKKNTEVNCENIKSHYVHVNDNEYKSIKTWSAYRCLYAEIKVGQKQFMLRNGVWYRVNDDFVEQVNKSIKDIQAYEHSLPKYNHESEGLYNKAVSQGDSSYALMDKKNLNFGGSYSKIEFCDLIKDAKHFVHVKYYRSSSTLSHLFSQGLVSAEAFVSDSDFRKKLNTKLPKALKLTDVVSRPDSSKYCVVYAIATEKKSLEDLPFFSKVTLKNAVKRLGGLGFKVRICFIEVDPQLLITKKIKPGKAKANLGKQKPKAIPVKKAFPAQRKRG